MKVVIDTNVIVSALINPKGYPAKTFNLFLNEKLQLYYDNRIIEEYVSVLNRERFGFDKQSINALMDYIKNTGVFTIANPISIEFEDEEDKKFLEVALSAKADYLITGNIKHFPDSDIIITPKNFILYFPC